MKSWKRTLGTVLLLATLGVAGSANAKKVSNPMLALTPTKTDCDAAKHTYRYVATWRAPAGSRFVVNTGNACHLGANACGGNYKIESCTATCNAAGQCSAPLNACLIGKGAQWVQVTALDGPDFQRVPAWAPDGKKKYCP